MLGMIKKSIISRMHHSQFLRLVICVKLRFGVLRNKVLLVKVNNFCCIGFYFIFYINYHFALDCGYNCHARCEMKVPPTCTKEKGKVVKGIVRSGTISNPGSPWGTISCK